MAKTNQNLKQKMKPRMYTAREKMLYVNCGCDDKNKPPTWLLDKIADEKLKGGFNTSRSNQCPICFQQKSKNGSCGC